MVINDGLVISSAQPSAINWEVPLLRLIMDQVSFLLVYGRIGQLISKQCLHALTAIK